MTEQRIFEAPDNQICNNISDVHACIAAAIINLNQRLLALEAVEKERLDNAKELKALLAEKADRKAEAAIRRQYGSTEPF